MFNWTKTMSAMFSPWKRNSPGVKQSDLFVRCTCNLQTPMQSRLAGHAPDIAEWSSHLFLSLSILPSWQTHGRRVDCATVLQLKYWLSPLRLTPPPPPVVSWSIFIPRRDLVVTRLSIKPSTSREMSNGRRENLNLPSAARGPRAADDGNPTSSSTWRKGLWEGMRFSGCQTLTEAGKLMSEFISLGVILVFPYSLGITMKWKKTYHPPLK